MGLFTAEQVAALASGTVRFDLLVQLDFTTGPQRWWNGDTHLEAGGRVWEPFFGAATIEGIGFSGQAVAEKFTFKLPAASHNDVLTSALAETHVVQGRVASVMLQFFDDIWRPVGYPVGLVWGFMQKPSISRTAGNETDGGTRSISLDCENIFYNRARPPAGRLTDRDQQTRHPGDRMMQFVPTLAGPGYTITYPDY